MNDLRQAAQQALEALIAAEETLREQSETLHQGFEPVVMVETGLAITTLRAALEQPASVNTKHCLWARNGNAPCQQPAAWVGLTDEEITQTLRGNGPDLIYYARAIEAKLKEKNT